LLELRLPSPIQKLNSSFLEEKSIQLYVKRDDLIHPIISGNKWRKLKYNIQEAKGEEKDTLLSFGGAYSNHIHALAEAASNEGLKSIGIIRGDELPTLNGTLSFAKSCGMQLHFIDREAYKTKTELAFIENLKIHFGDFYLIPEGGHNALGAKGCEEIVSEISIDYDVVTVACGTGTTMAGIVNALPQNKQAIGFPVLKGGMFLKNEIEKMLISKNETLWSLETEYHFGGYGKWNDELIRFINTFENEYNIPLDQIYTGKMMWGLFDLIRKNHFKKNTVIIAVHTGGLQGKNSIKSS
jgi:1-aminocyclopropane-1-carboxylate deaminase